MAAGLTCPPSRVWALPILTALLAWSPVASAQDDRSQLTVDSVRFVGVERIDESALRDVLATRSSPWLPWREPFPFDPEELQVDLRRIAAYYQDHGFPDGRAVSHDVSIDAAAREVDVTIRVAEGEPIVIERIVLENFEVLGDQRIAALRKTLPIAPGDIAAVNQILAGSQLAATTLKNEGYAYAEVSLEQEMPAPRRLLVRYVAKPGAQAYFGPIEVVGNASVTDDIVRRQLTYRPGELFRQDQLRAAERQLYGLELFQFATINPVETGEPLQVPTRVTVAEGDHRRLRFAAGWGTEEKLRGEASWRHVNFYGGARVLAVRGKWSALDSGGEVDFTQPYVFRPELSLSYNGHWLYADEFAYRAWSQGGRTTLNGRVSDRTTWTSRYTHEWARSEITEAALNDPTLRDTLIALGLDPTTGRQEGLESSLMLALEHTTTNDLLNPRQGYSASAQVEQAGTVFPGDFNYTRLNVDVRGYLPVRESVVVAARLRGAVTDPVGGAANVPFYKRYFLGGSTSLRGWGRFEVAPLSAGLPIGGFSLIESSVELRTRLGNNLGLVLFLDAGNVWDGNWKFRPGDLLYDVGPGLRYYTPVGPVRVDLAYQLTPIEGLVVEGEPADRRWRIHFSIGQSF